MRSKRIKKNTARNKLYNKIVRGLAPLTILLYNEFEIEPETEGNV